MGHAFKGTAALNDERIEGVYQAKEFGIIDDDSADNIDKLADAASYISTQGGGELFLPYRYNGIYRVSDGFDLAANVRLSMGPGAIIENQSNTAGNAKYTVRVVPYSQIVGARIKHKQESTTWNGACIKLDGSDRFPGNNFDGSQTLIQNVQVETPPHVTNTSVGTGSGILLLASTPSDYIQLVKFSNLDIRRTLTGIKLEATDLDDTVTAQDDGSGNLQINWSSHPMDDGDAILFSNSGGALPTGLAVGTTYYVTGSSTNAFLVEATVGGGAISYSDAGTGTHTASPKPWVNGNTFSDIHFIRSRFGILANSQGGATQVNGNLFNNIQYQTSTHSYRICDFEGGAYNSVKNLMSWDWQGTLGAGFDAIQFNATYNARFNYVEAMGLLDETNITGDKARNAVSFLGRTAQPMRQFTVSDINTDAPATKFTGCIAYVSNGDGGAPCIAVSNGTNWIVAGPMTDTNEGNIGDTISAT